MKTLFAWIAAAGLAGAAWTAENWTKDQQAVLDVFKVWTQAQPGWEKDRILALWAPEFTCWDFREKAPLDRTGTEKMMSEFHRKMKVTDFGIQTESVIIQGGLAVASGRYSERFTTPEGVAMKGGGPWTCTLRLAGDKWLITAMSYLNRQDGPVDQAVVEREIAALEHVWAKAYVDRDTATLDRLEAEEWVCTTADGEVFTKAEDIADVKSAAYQATVFKMEDVKARIYGNMAVATARQTEVATYKGADASKVLRCTDVWVRRDGRWQCVATHLSYAKKG
ncbi:nuclear transport factor 2 family protein [Oleiharenicola lentus]|nr:nuclear transport factor 2 family protein [Oleiharenicola lentus]